MNKQNTLRHTVIKTVSILLIALLIISLFSLLPAARSVSYADSTYTWENIGTYKSEEPWRDTYSFSVTEYADAVELYTKVNETSADGKQNYIELYFTCSQPPMSIEAGSEVSLTITKKASVTRHEKTTWPYSNCEASIGDPNLNLDANSYGSSFRTSDYSSSFSLGYPGYSDGEYEVSATMPNSTNAGEEVSIYFTGTAGIFEWRYRLMENKSADETEPPEVISENVRKPADSIIDKSGLVYKVLENNKNVEFMGTYDENRKTVVIPATIKADGFTYKVTSIRENALEGLKKLNKVTIGSNVTEIKDKAFYGCKKLSKVTIGKKVTKIGKKAFYGCSNLKTITVNSKSLKKAKIGAKAFTKINKKAVVKCPKGKAKTYRTIFRAKGAPKTVKFK